MSIGIVGAGALGSNVARLLANNGVAATLAARREPDALADLARGIGPSITAGSLEDAASADIVLLALRWVDLEAVLGSLPTWNGRIVIDGANAVAFLDEDSPERNDPTKPLAAYGIKAIDLGGRHSSQVVRELVPGARLVKAFNHIDARLVAQPQPAGGQRVMFYSGDDAGAKAQVRDVLGGTGHFPVDLGALDVGGPLASLPFGPLAGASFIKV